MLGEMLSLNNIVLEDETTQIGGSRATDEVDLSICHNRRYKEA